MGLFGEPLAELREYLDRKQAAGELDHLRYDGATPWPLKPTPVLKEDTAVQLGSSASTSLFLMLWTGEDGILKPNRIALVGPGLESARDATLPFGLIILVQGDFGEPYEAYRELRSKVYDTRPWGLSAHIRPERSQIWCRVSKEAMAEGFSLATYGSLFIGQLESLPAVSAVEVAFITNSKEDIEALRPVSEKAQTIIDALIKMYEEMNFDCETCDYVEVCEEVVELKAIRKRLKERS